MSLNLGIVTPTLNSIGFLGGMLNSISPLLDAGAELIVVDSGSTDGTLELIQSYERVIVLHEEKGNIYRAINKGIALSEKKWVTYINSDDLIDSQAAIASLDYADLMDECNLIYGNFNLIDECGALIENRYSPAERYIESLLKSGFMPFSQPGTIFRKNLWHNLSGFNDNFKYAADYDFFFRAMNRYGGFVKSPESCALASFRVHSNQLSNIRSKEMKLEAVAIRRLNSGGVFLSMPSMILSFINWKLINFKLKLP